MSSQVVQVVQVELEAGRRCAECGTETARVDGRFTLRTRAETARPEGEMESVRSVKLNEGTGTKYVGARCKRTSRSRVRVHGRTVIMVTGVSLSDRRSVHGRRG